MTLLQRLQLARAYIATEQAPSNSSSPAYFFLAKEIARGGTLGLALDGGASAGRARALAGRRIEHLDRYVAQISSCFSGLSMSSSFYSKLFRILMCVEHREILNVGKGDPVYSFRGGFFFLLLGP